MNIRTYRESDLETLREITAICFDGTSIDQNIEELHGVIAGKDWRWRKKRHVDVDVAVDKDGILVAEVDGEAVGYISCRPDRESGIGWIANFAVLPAHQKRGLGRALMDAALDYLRQQGMEYVKIEALEQNEIAPRFYSKLGFQETARQIHYIMPLAAKA